MALNGLICADVPLSNYSLTHDSRQFKSRQVGVLVACLPVRAPRAAGVRGSWLCARTQSLTRCSWSPTAEGSRDDAEDRTHPGSLARALEYSSQVGPLLR